MGLPTLAELRDLCILFAPRSLKTITQVTKFNNLGAEILVVGYYFFVWVQKRVLRVIKFFKEM